MGHQFTALMVVAAAAYAGAILVFASLAFTTTNGTSGPGYLGAAIVVSVLLCSPTLMLLAKQASPDVWFILLVGLAALAFLQERPLAAVALFSLASLQRPEAWLFGVATLLLATGAPELRNSWRRWTPLAVAPILWLAMGAWFHHLLAGLQASRDNATTLHRSTGLVAAVTGVGPGLASGVGWAVVIVGVLVVIWNVSSLTPWRPTRRPDNGPPGSAVSPFQRAIAYLSLLLAIDVACFLTLGALGTALLPRYLATGQFILIALCATALAHLVWGLGAVWRPGTWSPIESRPLALLIASVVTVAMMIGAARGAREYPSLGTLLRSQHSVEDTLGSALAKRPQQSLQCGNTYSAVLAQLPVIALRTRQPLTDVLPYLASSANTVNVGTLVFPRDRLAFDGAGVGPAQPLVARIGVPPGFRITASDTHWAVLQRC